MKGHHSNRIGRTAEDCCDCLHDSQPCRCRGATRQGEGTRQHGRRTDDSKRCKPENLPASCL
eukprot:4668380-Alexandrium_andersonii.AAC.1